MKQLAENRYMEMAAKYLDDFRTGCIFQTTLPKDEEFEPKEIVTQHWLLALSYMAVAVQQIKIAIEHNKRGD